MRIGVIGCGRIAEKHLAAYRKLEGLELVVTDIVEKGAMIAEHYGAEWNPSPEDVLDGNQVDAVDVCTPTPTHASMILDALANGKHVFCEKPLARNLAEATEIKAAAERSGSVVMVGYLYRFHPAFQFVREVLEQGVIGDPHFGMLRLGGRGSHKAWKHMSETGGGAGNEVLVHMLDLALWYFGEPTRVENLYTDTILARREVEGQAVDVDAEDVVLLRLEMGGAQILVQSDLVTPSYMNYIEIQGGNGSIFTSILDMFPTSVYCKEERGVYGRGHNLRQFPAVDLFERELAEFVDCVRNGAAAAINSVDDSVRLMDVVESALAAGTQVALPTDA